MGSHQLRSLFQQHLGATPAAIKQTTHVLFAKKLIHETGLSMADIAEASGFASVRRFNQTLSSLFGRAPETLRRKSLIEGIQRCPRAAVNLQLRYRPPYDWIAMIAHLKARSIEGIELVDPEVYRRTIALNGHVGSVEVRSLSQKCSLDVSVRFPCLRSLPSIVARIRRVFDLDADIEAIGTHLSQDTFLAPFVAARPGLRAPGSWDGFELAVRAVLGQQITVAAACRLATQIVAHAGESVPQELRSHPRLAHVFPGPERLTRTDLSSIGMPAARREALRSLAVAAAADKSLFHPLATLQDALTRLEAIKGIGEWTAQYIALRALRETDAFPASDAALLRTAALIEGVKQTPASLLSRSEVWRPWRSYAAQHLWSAGAAGLNV